MPRPEDIRRALAADDSGDLTALLGEAGPDARAVLWEFVAPDADSAELDLMLRQRAIWALGVARDEALPERLAPLLPRLDERSRISAADAMGRIATPAALEVIERLRDDESPDVRKVVAVALGRIRLPEAEETLRTMRENDPADVVRASAARSLRQA